MLHFDAPSPTSWERPKQSLMYSLQHQCITSVSNASIPSYSQKQMVLLVTILCSSFQYESAHIFISRQVHFSSSNFKWSVTFRQRRQGTWQHSESDHTRVWDVLTWPGLHTARFGSGGWRRAIRIGFHWQTTWMTRFHFRHFWNTTPANNALHRITVHVTYVYIHQQLLA